MLRSKITSWFFLGYLVLLLNFGSSLHHAPIFGLHSHHHHGSSASESHSCCCCHSHLPQTTLIPSLATEEVPAAADKGFNINDVSQADHDCAFCKFFDEYNVVVASFDCDLIETPFSLFLSELPDGASAEFVPKVARGPPTA